LSASFSAAGQESAPVGESQVSTLTLEQLAAADVVFAAARRNQTLREAAAWVTVVNAADIRRQGFRTLGEILHSLPSFYLVDDRNYSYVGVRGFGRPGDYNTRILLLVDGLRLNDNIYDMAPVGHDFLVPVELIERVEIVRGPAAALYGNSAFFAVVNVITRRPRAIGGEAQVAAASAGTGSARLSYGTQLADGTEFALSIALLNRSGRTHWFPDFGGAGAPTTSSAGADGEDDLEWNVALSRGAWSFAGAHTSRGKEVPTGAYDTLLGDDRTRTQDDRTLLTAIHQGGAWNGITPTTRLHWGRYAYEGSYASAPGLEGLYRDRAIGVWLGGDLNLTATLLGRHRITAGLDVRHDLRQRQTAATVAPAETEIDVQHAGTRWGLYVQDEVTLATGLVAHLGVRHDDAAHLGARTSPRLGLVWNPGDRSAVKLLYGSAFRAPNEYESHYYAATGPELRSEAIRTLELVFERTMAPDVRLVATAYASQIDDLITLRGDSEGELGFANVEHITSRGAELALEARAGGLDGRASYSFGDAHERGGASLTNSPRHLAKLSLARSVVAGRLEASANAQFTSARRTLRGQRVPRAWVTNASLRAPQLVGPIDVAATVYNLFDAQYSDPGSEEHRQDVIPQDRRSFRLQATWRF
jgi:iron complex outermembrane receptor protein